MELSIFLAKVFGLYFILIAISMLLNKSTYRALMLDIANTPSMVLFIGIFTLIIGILLVVSHNIWVSNWQILITIMAWLTLIGGIVRVYFPQQALRIGLKLMQNDRYFSIATIISLLLGILFCYLGFFS